jgi:cysteine synthase A
MQHHLNVADGVLDAVGQTPLIRLSRFLSVTDIELFAKLEACNPGGSAKDRPARTMIKRALRRGQIDQNTTVIESSSGNMGIGLAQACRYHGLRFICVVDARAQKENLKIIEALGGEIDLVTEPIQGDFLTARIARVCELLERIPNSHWTNQYGNRDNPLAHQRSTIREVDDALDGQFDVLFVATSSTGTVQGCREYLRLRNHPAEVVAVDAEGSVLFGGDAGTRLIPGLGAGKEPALAASQSFDGVARVSDLECVIGCRQLANREAMLVGGSAGGVLMAIDRMKCELAGKRCVAILHDSGTRYLDTVYDDEWVHRSLNCSPTDLQRFINEPSRDRGQWAAA